MNKNKILWWNNNYRFEHKNMRFAIYNLLITTKKQHNTTSPPSSQQPIKQLKIKQTCCTKIQKTTSSDAFTHSKVKQMFKIGIVIVAQQVQTII